MAKCAAFERNNDVTSIATKKEKAELPVFNIAILTIMTMIAFASNSVFARLSLSLNAVDPASFTAIRLISGALLLLLLVSLRKKSMKTQKSHENFLKTLLSSFALFGYAAFFSFAYISIETGIGALILFACVQFTMIGYALYSGERPSFQSWLGIFLAFSGFVYLVFPGLSAPDLKGAFLMALSGIAWGIYSLNGKGIANPVQASARNFIFAIPLCIFLVLIFLNEQNLTGPGIMLAIASGAGTSALGYVLWFKVLKFLTTTNAAIVQLTVPVLATLGGIILLNEPLTLHYGVATILILGGIALSILAARKKAHN